MSLSLNIDSILNKTWGNYTPGSKKNTSSATSSGTANSNGVDDNIFAKASALVAEYKSKQEENKNSKDISQITKYFLEILGRENLDKRYLERRKQHHLLTKKYANAIFFLYPP